MTNKLIGGKTAEEWDDLWQFVPGGLTRRHPELKGKVGLLRVSLHCDLKYIGKAVEQGPGFFKRLYDFHRESPSGRNHHGGELIYENRDEVEIEVLVIDAGWLAPKIAEELRAAMIERHGPPWNADQSAVEEAKHEQLAKIANHQRQVVKTVLAEDVII
jgi:hypothetical protein